MAISQEQFDRFITRLEGISQRQPSIYRFRVALLALLGYIYILLLIAGLIALLGLLAWIMFSSGRINRGMIMLAFGLLAPAWLMLSSLWVKFPHPEGLTLKREQSPELFRLVHELTNGLQAPKFDHILLTPEFNAAVSQVPQFGIFGWHHNYLILGLPLMQALSLDEFKAVLAHELGHLSANHSRFAIWIYRIRKTWMQLYERLHQSDQQDSSFLFNRFLNWYWPKFNAYSFVLARLDEYEADRCAAQLAGAEHAAKALIKSAVVGRYLEEHFWTEVNQKVEDLPDPPKNLYTSMFAKLRQPLAEKDHQAWLTDALASQTNNQDTHPCLTDRLEALGYVPEQAPKLSQSGRLKATAAEQLFGRTLHYLTAQFNREWHESVSTPWRQRYAYLSEAKAKLNTLSEKAEQGSLTVEELWERGLCLLKLKKDQEAMPILQEVLKQQPEHVQANFIVGQFLLEQADATGIPLIEKAIELNPGWLIDGCELIYNFLNAQGQLEAAQAYLKRAEQHHQLLEKAQEERYSLADLKKFKPHSLHPAEVAHIQRQLSSYSEVLAAYLVEKEVTLFPDDRFCVLGIVRKSEFIETEAAPDNLIHQLSEKLEFPVQTWIMVLNREGFSHLEKRFKAIENSLILRS
jgi:Zn-dependent protease with chaperone function